MAQAQVYVNVPRERCFSLGDFHDFERCPFSFFVRHHLQKKYELEEATENQAIGSLLDLAIKKYHVINQNGKVEDPENLIPASVKHMREDIEREGVRSFYGPQAKFLTSEVIGKAQDIWNSYLRGVEGKVKKAINLNKIKPFWSYTIMDGESFRSGDKPVKIWGGPDAIEMGEDGMPEVVDYKYFEDNDKGKSYLDMNLMPKVYMLLTTQELVDQGYSKARFKVRMWQAPKDDSMYEEFDLGGVSGLSNFLMDKIRRILDTKEVGFCTNSWCKVCKHADKTSWIKELEDKGWVKVGTGQDILEEVNPNLPF